MINKRARVNQCLKIIYKNKTSYIIEKKMWPLPSKNILENKINIQ